MSSPVLICAQSIGSLRAEQVGAAVAAGLARESEVLPLPESGEPQPWLAAQGFDARMRAAFAIALVAGTLNRDLRGTFAGEIATRARQAGVGCHLICAGPAPKPFTARIYDLQTVLHGDGEAGLAAAAERLRELL